MRVILNRDIIAMFAIGGFWIVSDRNYYFSDLANALYRSIIYGAIFYSLKIGFLNFRNRDGIGMGDVKLVTAAGFYVYFDMFSTMILLSCALSFFYIFVRSKKIKSHRYLYLPFGSMLSISIFVTWFAENTIYK